MQKRKSFMQSKCTLAMVQPKPLPGSYRYGGESLQQIEEEAIHEAKLLHDCGFDGIILQNMGDMPIRQISSVEAVAYMTAIAAALRRELPSFCIGILMNWDGCASLAVAEAAQADFVRVEHVYTGVEVTSAGLLQGQCCEITALKKRLQSQMPVYADVYETHGVPLGAKTIEDAAWENIYEAFADGLFLSGKTKEESISYVKRARKRVGDVPIILGGGATGDNVAELLQYYDGVCVGTWIKDGSLKNPVNPEKAKIFIDHAKNMR